jgi:acetylornithine deacetylase/succinyl-diaminopimelate desuccinylase-like protein
MLAGALTVRVLDEGVHSGDASGVVPSSFRILRQLVSRLEDEASGVIRPAELYAQVPAERIAQAKLAAAALGASLYEKFPFPAGMAPVTTDFTELVLNRSWRPQLAVTGFEGLPALADAGNVLLPYSTAKLSLRLPPTLDGAAALAIVKKTLEADPPYGATVEFEADKASTGWNAPALSPWLERSLNRASEAAFGAPAAFMGEGGSIPFMAMLGEKFPQAQFVVTGVLGPHSNAHGPNEFLHIPTGKKVTQAIAHVLADQHAAKA